MRTASTVTREQVEQYRNDGFTVVRGVLNGEEIEALRDAVEVAVASEENGDWLGSSGEDAVDLPFAYQRIFTQKVDLWRRHPSVSPFTLSRRLGDLAAKLEGREMRIWHDQALFKGPDDGVSNKTPWHQDALYWPLDPMGQQTTAWIALRPTTQQNGCLVFLQGSHQLGPQEFVSLSNPHNVFQTHPELKKRPAVACPLEAGDCTFHNGLTYHFAGPNRTDQAREGYAIIYMASGTAYSGIKHPVTDPMHLMAGARFDDRFPIVGKLPRGFRRTS